MIQFFKTSAQRYIPARAIVFVVLMALFGNVYADNKPTKKHQIIAGFLLHFTSFIEWPKNEYPYVEICIVGDDPFLNYIDDMVATRPINRSGKRIIINRIAVGNYIDNCNLIFITKKSATKIFWKSVPEHHSILLVSEFDDFIKQGGLIKFYNEEKHVRLDINLKAVKQAKLNISSELLKLARISQQSSEPVK